MPKARRLRRRCRRFRCHQSDTRSENRKSCVQRQGISLNRLEPWAIAMKRGPRAPGLDRHSGRKSHSLRVSLNNRHLGQNGFISVDVARQGTRYLFVGHQDGSRIVPDMPRLDRSEHSSRIDLVRAGHSNGARIPMKWRICGAEQLGFRTRRRDEP